MKKVLFYTASHLKKGTMAFWNDGRKELQEVNIIISNGFPLSAKTTLASMESLSLPLVQEVVLSADMQCDECQKRVADIITKMNETESVVVNVLEKTVTLTFRLPRVGRITSHQISLMNKTLLPKVAIIKHLFRSSRC